MDLKCWANLLGKLRKMYAIYLLMLNKIKEPKVMILQRKFCFLCCVLGIILFIFIFSGDQSDLHVIIFDEIDAICKVGHQKVNLYLLLHDYILFCSWEWQSTLLHCRPLLLLCNPSWLWNDLISVFDSPKNMVCIKTLLLNVGYWHCSDRSTTLLFSSFRSKVMTAQHSIA